MVSQTPRLRATIGWSVLTGVAVGVVLTIAVSLDSVLLLSSTAASVVVIAAQSGTVAAHPRTIAFSYTIAGVAGLSASLVISSGHRTLSTFDVVAAACAAAVTCAAMLTSRLVHPPAAGIAAAMGATRLVPADALLFTFAIVAVVATAELRRRASNRPQSAALRIAEDSDPD